MAWKLVSHIGANGKELVGADGEYDKAALASHRRASTLRAKADAAKAKAEAEIEDGYDGEDDA